MYRISNYRFTLHTPRDREHIQDRDSSFPATRFTLIFCNRHFHWRDIGDFVHFSTFGDLSHFTCWLLDRHSLCFNAICQRGRVLGHARGLPRKNREPTWQLCHESRKHAWSKVDETRKVKNILYDFSPSQNFLNCVRLNRRNKKVSRFALEQNVESEIRMYHILSWS